MSFDTLAPHYRWMEGLLAGGKLQDCRTAFLDEVRGAHNVLLLGEGNGRFLKAFVRVNGTANITVLDSSAGMLRQAQKRVLSGCAGGKNSNLIQYIHADVFEWSPPPQSFDLIATNFFFDCFRADQLSALVPLLVLGATANARWLVCDFRIPPHGLPRWRAQIIVAAMYRFFRVITRLPARVITPIDSLLRDAGFYLCQRHITEWGLLHADLWQRACS